MFKLLNKKLQKKMHRNISFLKVDV